MKKWIVVFMMVILVLSLLAGCGSSSSSSGMTENASETAPSMAAPAAAAADFGGDHEKDKKSETAQTADSKTGITSTGSDAQTAANAILDQRKIIRTANVSILVDNYDKAYGQIQTMVESAGIGYIQQSSVGKQGKMGKSGMVVVRVDADKFTTTLSGIKGLGEVTDASENTEDATDKFYDTESELRLLKYEQSRLEEYLKKITDPDVIFKTESRLTDIRHQIEGLTGTLNKLSNLVKLSTITINITEKNLSDSVKEKKEKSYWEKLSDGFIDSVEGVGGFFAGVVLVLASLLPILIPVAIIGLIGFYIYKKRSRKE